MAVKRKSVAELLRPAEHMPSAPRPAPYELSTTNLTDTPEATPLAPQADLLSPQLREIALRYVGARRRSGQALLEAARHLSDARQIAQEGEWQLFLEATTTQYDTAVQLLNIHLLTTRDPRVADSITQGRLNQSAAALLARPTTPPEVIVEVIAAEQPIAVSDVRKAIREAKQRRSPHVDNLKISSYPHAPDAPDVPELQVITRVLSDADEQAITRLCATLIAIQTDDLVLTTADIAVLNDLATHLELVLQRVQQSQEADG